jgi:hypothetical protein
MMPFELRVTPGEFLARVRGWGRDDFASTTEAIRRIGEDARLLPGMPVLMDVRELEYLATPPEVATFASRAGEGLFAGHPIAILVRRGAQFGIAKSFAEKSERAGTRTEVFAEPDLALDWLRSASAPEDRR